MVEIFAVECLILHGVRIKLLNFTPGGSRDCHSSLTSLSNYMTSQCWIVMLGRKKEFRVTVFMSYEEHMSRLENEFTW